jgi:D-3-phosphoglycerate dehydrogenase / 2-oxoglutarate reductase
MTQIQDLWPADAQPNWVIDWDSTLCQVETLDALVEDVDPEALSKVEAITSQGMGGDLPFDESLRLRFECFEARAEDVERTARRLATLIDPTAIARRECIKRLGGRVVIVSGGFEELILPSLPQLGISPDQVYANRLVYDEAGRVTGADPGRLTSRDNGKAAQVEALGLSGFTIVIGDGSNDLRIRQAGYANLFGAYTAHTAREKVIREADFAVDSFGLPLLT